ncbi:signal peptidase I [Geoglobus acetivorans]|uniref:Peptidase S26 domain-containing protein n=1 Tax=Geoglobus acetivorans TaxID=565033 RepID=A0A0A7GIW3_GEOAI|nr:hypothetical protein GACE_1850 [Geoglobus acetivorans]
MIELLIAGALATAFFAYNHREGIGRKISLVRTRKHIHELLENSSRSRNATIAMAVAEFAVFLVIVYLGITMKIFFAAVVTNSMYPTFERGDIVLVQTIFKEPEKGDIIMFVREDVGYSVTHRVLKVVGDKVYTGGDASGPDPNPISKSDIIGKAVLVFGKPIVVKGVGNYFILDAKELRDIGPYGQEYLFYKKMLDVLRQYALSVVVIGISAYIYSLLRELR